MKNQSSSSLQSQLYGLLIPQEILDHFEITSVIEREQDVTIELTEKPERIPKQLQGKQAVSNGYINQLELQSFPIQAKSCYLRLLRRRWKERGANEGTYYNEYDFAAEGTKATKAFGAFLKEYL